jgi:hypothetical protein
LRPVPLEAPQAVHKHHQVRCRPSHVWQLAELTCWVQLQVLRLTAVLAERQHERPI